jgi:Bacterial Ig domain
LRIGGNGVWPEWFAGLIDEVRVYSRALTAGEVLADMATPIGGGSPPPPPPSGDTTPPSVEVTAPTAGAIVWGTTTVSARASDDVGVVGVQFLVDGANLGAEDTTEPFSTAWDTTAGASGSHALTAAARDAAGNRTTSNAVVVQVSKRRRPQ